MVSRGFPLKIKLTVNEKGSALVYSTENAIVLVFWTENESFARFLWQLATWIANETWNEFWNATLLFFLISALKNALASSFLFIF